MIALFPSLPGSVPVAGRHARFATLAVVVAAHLLAGMGLMRLVPAGQLAVLTQPLTVRLIEVLPEPPPAAVLPQPLEPLPRAKAPPPPAPIPVIETPATAATIVTMATEAMPASFVVAAPAPPVAVPPASTFAPTVVAARFDAAYLNNPAPVYPAASRRLGEEGKVVLRVRVDPSGQAEAIDISASSGFPRLDAAARAAVAQWRFVPARRGDEPIPAWVLVPIVFNLEG